VTIGSRLFLCDPYPHTLYVPMKIPMLPAICYIVLACLPWTGTAGEPVRRGRPNIIFVLIDDMGWTDVGCFGSPYYRTPNIDRLASSGMRFTQAYAACAVCSPTRAAILTGKYPARLHITDWIPGEGTPKESRFQVPEWQKHLPLEEVTLAEALKGLGYRTACIGKWHLGETNYFPERQGFDLNIAGGAIGHPASYFWPYGDEGASHRVPGLAQRGGSEGEYLTDRLTDEALRFIEDNREKPFFLYLAHYAVHSPLMGKKEVVEEYGELPGAKGQSNAVYAAMVQGVDDSVGRILGGLKELGLSDRTVLVFTSDNGGAVHFGKPQATSNLPLRLGKGYAYEGGLRVPLVIRAPGLTKPGSACDAPVISQDFFPTLLELAGAKKSASRTARDGLSLVPLLEGQGRLRRQELFWHYPHHWNGTGVSPYSVIRKGDWKLVRFYESGREELYNLHDDCGEQHDLAATEPKTQRQLSSRLNAWLKEVGAQMPLPRL
jgi:arylsulfatase A